MKTDYTALDAALLARIKQKPANFTELQSGDVQKAAEALVAPGKPSYFSATGRCIGRRLRALRIAGKIVYNTKTGWSIAP